MRHSLHDETGNNASESQNHSSIGIMALALQFLAVLAMVLMPFVATNDAYAQVTLQDLIKPQQQIQIDPNIKIQPNPNLQVLCLPPFINKDNKCVCPIGQVKDGNTCKPFNIQILCQAPFVPKNGQCVCPDGLVKSGNTCKPIQILCLAPFVPKNGQCVCPDGLVKSGNTCKPLQILCLAPFVPKNGQCVCPSGQVKVGNTCEPVNVPILCLAPFVPSNGQCVCPDGKIKVGNSCQTPQVQCNAPFVPGSNGTCVCPQGLQKVGNQCLVVQNTPQCNFPFVLNNAQTSCVCASGYGLNANGTQCIRKQTQTTPPVSKQLIAEIQRCLNKVGYDAGPVDGDIGSRTTSAWLAFRQDEGLQARPNRFSDAVTQDRLFQACAKKAAVTPQPKPKPQPVPQPVPQPEPEPTDPDAGLMSPATNFDADQGYPAIQCVSENLVGPLAALFGQDEEIGICGLACIPIPDGMTPQQIDATMDNVNWCLNCTKVGEEGLICSAPALEEENAN